MRRAARCAGMRIARLHWAPGELKMPPRIDPNLILPVIDPLEPRTLLAGLEFLQVVRDPGTLLGVAEALKKDGDDDDDDDDDDDEDEDEDDDDDDDDEDNNSGKGKGKGKKGKGSDVPEITVLLGSQNVADNSATIDFGRTLL